MAQAANSQQHEQAKGRKIRQAVPVDGQRANLQGDWVDVGIGQHVGRYCARHGTPGQDVQQQSPYISIKLACSAYGISAGSY